MIAREVAELQRDVANHLGKLKITDRYVGSDMETVSDVAALRAAVDRIEKASADLQRLWQQSTQPVGANHTPAMTTEEYFGQTTEDEPRTYFDR